MRRLLGLWIVLGAACLAGCGRGDSIWVTGVLHKGGEMYKPPEGRKLALYFCPITDGASGKPSGDVVMALRCQGWYLHGPGGREGYGILPGNYRIAVVETLRREALDNLKNASKPTRGQKRINNDTNFLEASFGETTSPFVRDLKTSTKLTLDMARPTE